MYLANGEVMIGRGVEIVGSCVATKGAEGLGGGFALVAGETRERKRYGERDKRKAPASTPYIPLSLRVRGTFSSSLLRSRML
jgi:hypothetical protein